jgi:hypothetical protein
VSELNRRTHHSRNLRFAPATYQRIKAAADSEAITPSAWLRIAIDQQLKQEQMKSEVGQLRDELGANFTRVLDCCRSVSNAQQAAIALIDTLTKYILSVSPEPSADAQKVGRRRYEQFLKSVATALEGDVLRAFAALDDDDHKKPN